MTRKLPEDPQRHQLQRDALVGFLGFFAGLAVIQATINVFQPQPAVWPAVLALITVLLAVIAWRWNRHQKGEEDGRNR